MRKLWIRTMCGVPLYANRGSTLCATQSGFIPCPKPMQTLGCNIYNRQYGSLILNTNPYPLYESPFPFPAHGTLGWASEAIHGLIVCVIKRGSMCTVCAGQSTDVATKDIYTHFYV